MLKKKKVHKRKNKTCKVCKRLKPLEGLDPKLNLSYDWQFACWDCWNQSTEEDQNKWEKRDYNFKPKFMIQNSINVWDKK